MTKLPGAAPHFAAKPQDEGRRRPLPIIPTAMSKSQPRGMLCRGSSHLGRDAVGELTHVTFLNRGEARALSLAWVLTRTRV